MHFEILRRFPRQCFVVLMNALRFADDFISFRDDCALGVVGVKRDLCFDRPVSMEIEIIGLAVLGCLRGEVLLFGDRIALQRVALVGCKLFGLVYAKRSLGDDLTVRCRSISKDLPSFVALAVKCFFLAIGSPCSV